MKDGDKRFWDVKFCVSAGTNNDWAMYVAPSAWPNDVVADFGNKLPEELARGLVQLLDLRAEFPEDGPIDVLQRKWRE